MNRIALVASFGESSFASELKNRQPGNAGIHLLLEDNLQTKPEIPLVDQPAFRIDVGNLRESVQVQGAIGIHLHTGDIGPRIGKMGRVSHVETLSSKLKGPVFLKFDSAEKRRVQINGTRSTQSVKSCCAEARGSYRGECKRIKPFIDVASVSHVRQYLIRTLSASRGIQRCPVRGY